MGDSRIFVIADIHGELRKLDALLEHLRVKANFSLDDGDELVQLGDKCDRGPDTFGVIERFRLLWKEFPFQVHMLWGNHEDMMWNAAIEAETRPDSPKREWDLFMMNGGGRTLKSYYSRAGEHIGKSHFATTLRDLGHKEFFDVHNLYMETEKYFFCHAPIGKVDASGYRGSIPPGGDFREDKPTLIWNYQGEVTSRWVDPDPAQGKICVYGHIHGLKWDHENNQLLQPTVRRYGNAFLLDTGCGCHPDAVLSALELPTLTVYTSEGKVFHDVVHQ